MRLAKPRSHVEVVKQWPSAAAFAHAIGVKSGVVRNMVYRGRIPSRYFTDVISAVAAAGFPNLTYAELSAMGSRAKEQVNGQ